MRTRVGFTWKNTCQRSRFSNISASSVIVLKSSEGEERQDKKGLTAIYRVIEKE